MLVMAATIKQVAKTAGVSTSTVSHVLNGTHYVSPELTARVMAAVEALDYKLNPVARSLAGGRLKMVGVLVPDVGTSYAGEVIKGIDSALSEYDHELILLTTHRDRSKVHRALTTLTQGLTDGVIIMVPDNPQAYLQAISAPSFPYVLIDYTGPENYHSVAAAHYQGAFDATHYLLELGHRRIGFIQGEPFLSSASDRYAGYQQALEEYGITPDPALVVEGNFRREGGYEGTVQLLSLATPPTAIFAANDQMAMGAADAARVLEYQVPQDISIIGFDGIPETGLIHPALSTVQQPLHEMGRMAVQVLMKRIDTPDAPVERVEMPTRLVVRETTAPPR